MSSNNMIVLDLETQRSFKEVGKANLQRLKVSVVGIYDYLTGQYRTFEEKETMALDQRLGEIDLVIGFNIRRFDFPVLAPYLFRPIDQLPVLDLLDDIEQARGHRVSLDSLAAPTLKQHKSGRGADALRLFKENRMDELKKYCLDDVRLTKEIYEYGCREGRVFFTSSWDYKTYEIPVNWKARTRELLHQPAPDSEDFPTSLF